MGISEVKDIIRNRRLELGLTMKEVAEAVGVSEGTVSRWEAGNISNMKRNRIAALAKVLNISPSIIMGFDELPDCDKNISHTETKKMPADLKRILEEQVIMFDGEIISEDDKEIVKNMLVTMYEIAKKKNKRNK